MYTFPFLWRVGEYLIKVGVWRRGFVQPFTIDI